jgi:hypothetical protein
VNPLIVTAVAVLLALVLVVVLVRRHVPDTGLGPWLKESFGSWRPRRELAAIREESARLADPAAETGDLSVSDILAMGEPGQPYHQPVDLREVVSGRKNR